MPRDVSPTGPTRRARRAIERLLIPAIFVNRRVFDVARFEMHCLIRTARNLVDPRYQWRLHRWKRRRDISVNIGSGGKGRAGWVNIDARRHRDSELVLDVRRGLPLADNQAARIFAEHVVEHLDFRHDIPRVFGEFHRVLRPGGVLRIVVPDGRRFVEAYISGDNERWRELGWDLERLPADLFTPMHVLNHIFHQGGEHLFAYDFATIAYALRRAGFREIHRHGYRVSFDPELCLDHEPHAAYSLYVEARK
jgi:predicted SAM-dependent methyltransferase